MSKGVKIIGFAILIYICIWILFIGSMSIKLYLDYFGYQLGVYFMKLIYNL